MDRIYTIGHNKKSLSEFIGMLCQAGVTKIIDIRLNNTSQLVGFAKKEDLAFLLSLVGIEYEHLAQLAPTKEILHRFKGTKNWQEYEKAYLQLLEAQDPLALIEQSSSLHQAICFLCAEDKPTQCHRRLLAEYVQSRIPNIVVTHLFQENTKDGSRGHISSGYDPYAFRHLPCGD